MTSKTSKMIMFIVVVIFVAMLLVSWWMSQRFTPQTLPIESQESVEVMPEAFGTPTPTLIPGL